MLGLHSRSIISESLEGRVMQSISTVRKHTWGQKCAAESHCSRIYKVIGAAMILTFKEGSSNVYCSHSSHLARKSYWVHLKKDSSMWGIIYVINFSNISINSYGFPYVKSRRQTSKDGFTRCSFKLFGHEPPPSKLKQALCTRPDLLTGVMNRHCGGQKGCMCARSL